MLRALVFLATVLTAISAFAQPAEAHGRKTVGKFVINVGWLEEPAYVNQRNGAEIRINDVRTNEPILGAHFGLKVEITQGSTKREYPLRPLPGQLGTYLADLIPTTAGQYTFRFVGEVDGQKIDETFESGPNVFDDVVDGSRLEFPLPLATGGGTSDGQAVNQLSRRVATLEQALAEARDTANTGRILGFAGIVIGILGLVYGAVRGTGAKGEGRKAKGERL